MEMRYRPDIDGLRAVAILPVVAYHAFPGRMPGGFIGVDVFFVISGFLISSIIFSKLDQDNFDLSEFYARRIRRIFPALIAVLSACLIYGFFSLLADEYRQLGKHVAAGALFIQNFVLWSEFGYFDNEAITKPLLHLWSLAIEEQFYIIWPLLLIVAHKRHGSFLVATVVVGVLSFAYSIYLSKSNETAAFYSPVARFWELMLGGFLAYIVLHRSKILERFANVRAAIGAILLVVGFALINERTAFPGGWALFPTVGTFLVISAGDGAYLNRTVLSSRPMVVLGLISYPLYLWHWPLLSFAHVAVGGPPTPAIKMLCMAGAVALSWTTYRFLELPIRHAKVPGHRTFLITAAMILVGVVGSVSYATNGLLLRTPTELDKLGDTNFRWSEFVRQDVCHLDDPNLIEFSAICIESRRPLIALWGDSAAASLYPGLKNLQNVENFGIVQTTQSACAPIIGMADPDYRKRCGEVNLDILEAYRRVKPDVVIIHSAWGRSIEGELLTRIRDTLRDVKRDTGARLIVIGPPPRWRKSPRYTTYTNTTAGSPPQMEGSFDRDMQPAELYADTEYLLRKLSKDEGFAYVSLIDHLCQGDRCLARVGDSPTDWIATDEMHLSKAGSEFFMEKAFAEIKEGAEVLSRPSAQ